MDDAVSVKIVGDASGVAPAVDKTKSEIVGIDPVLAEINAGAQSTMASFQAAFAGIAESARTSFATVAASAEAGVAKVRASGAEMQTSWTGLTSVVGKFNGVLLGVTAVLAGGAMFDKAIHATTEWTQENLKLSNSLGITLERASGLHVTLNKLNIGVDTITGASQRLARQLKIHEAAIEELGIATRDSNGHFRDTLDILVDSMGQLGEYKAGIDRTAAAQRLFGRGAGDLTDLLRLTNEQIEEGTRVAHELGLVTTQEGVEAMRNYRDATNEAKDVIEAFKIQLGNALLPVLTDLANWMRSNGKQAVETFAGAIRDVIGALRFIVVSVKENIAQLELWGAEFSGLWEIIQAFCDHVKDVWNVMAKVLGDFPDWGKMKSDWESGMTAIDNSITSHLDHAMSVIDAAKLKLDGLNLQISAMGRNLTDAGSGLKVSSNPFDFSGFGKQAPLPDLTGGDTRLDNLKDPKGGKAKDDLVQQLDDQLTAKKAAWEKEQFAQGTAQEFSLESERDYWAKALARTDLSSKDKAAIEQKWIAASQAIQKEDIAKKLDGYKADIEAAGSNSAAKLKIMREEATFVHRMYGDKSKEAAAADAEVVRAERQAAEQLRQLWDGYYKHEADLKLLDVDMAQAAAQQQVDMGLKSKGQLLAQEKQFENQRFEIRRQELDREKTLIDPNRDPVAYQKASQAIETLERQHQQRLTQIDQQAVLQRTQIERNGINSWASSWASAMSKLVTFQAGAMTTLKSLWQGFQQAAGSVIEQLLEKWMAAEATKLIFGKTSAQATIASEAAKAGAGGVASMAAAPWPLDMGAPAFGASMAAAAMAFSGLNSAEGGDWRVKAGLYQLHTDEMVLPAWAAQGVRGMITGQAPANFNAPDAANDSSGDTHFHFHGQLIDKRSVEGFMRKHRQGAARAAHYHIRMGGNVERSR